MELVVTKGGFLQNSDDDLGEVLEVLDGVEAEGVGVVVVRDNSGKSSVAVWWVALRVRRACRRRKG